VAITEGTAAATEEQEKKVRASLETLRAKNIAAKEAHKAKWGSDIPRTRPKGFAGNLRHT
jgi:hypothetical protein